MKNFDKWNERKKCVEEEVKNNITVRKREIWWMSLGLNVGDEEDGKGNLFERPCLVVKKFNDKIVWIIPLSSKVGNSKYYKKIYFQGKESYVIISQLRIVSVKRLNRILSVLSFPQFKKIKLFIATFIK